MHLYRLSVILSTSSFQSQILRDDFSLIYYHSFLFFKAENDFQFWNVCIHHKIFIYFAFAVNFLNTVSCRKLNSTNFT